MSQSWETMTSVSADHIIQTPTQPVGSGRPQRESNPGPPHQESRALPQSYRAPHADGTQFASSRTLQRAQARGAWARAFLIGRDGMRCSKAIARAAVTLAQGILD